MSSPTQRLQGSEQFGSERFKVLEFWQWAYSDLLSNTLRGILAEFLVVQAVGAAGRTRKEWDAFDVITPEGLRIEVKSAAYIQTWHQDKLSKISFDIACKTSWDAETNTTDLEPNRSADIYVFALLHEKNRDRLNPTDLTQWTFFVLPTTRLNDLGPQKTISLNSLRKLDPIETSFERLADTIRQSSQSIKF